MLRDIGLNEFFQKIIVSFSADVVRRQNELLPPQRNRHVPKYPPAVWWARAARSEMTALFLS
jgi:hypothetical protein